MYGAAVRCEAMRASVFAGQKSPNGFFGEPDQWLALLIESLLVHGQGDTTRAEELRLRAFDDAPVSTGDIDGRRFEWIADADSRLGPVLEAMIKWPLLLDPVRAPVEAKFILPGIDFASAMKSLRVAAFTDRLMMMTLPPSVSCVIGCSSLNGSVRQFPVHVRVDRIAA